MSAGTMLPRRLQLSWLSLARLPTGGRAWKLMWRANPGGVCDSPHFGGCIPIMELGLVPTWDGTGSERSL